MPTQSVLRAVQLKLLSFAPVGFPGGVRPGVYFDQAPQTDGEGAPVHAGTQGYVVLKHRGTQSAAYAFGPETRELVNLELEVHYAKLSDCLAAADVIARNGGAPAQRLGLDYGTLPDLDRRFKLLAVRPVSGRQSFEALGAGGERVHAAVLGYRVELVRLAQGA